MTGRSAPGRAEFTGMLAMSMALAALGIDLLLPAFASIRTELGLAEDSTAVAGLVTAYLIGLAAGQLVYGPVADRFGRRPVLYAGYLIYAAGATLATLSGSLPLMLASRVLWGAGAAGPRVITLAVIRDRYEGEAMARAMSFVMAVFILVPVVAPSLGAALVALGSWRLVFAAPVAAVVIMALWAIRLPETLDPERRTDLRPQRIARAARFVASERRTVGYTLATMVLFGAFTSYLGSSEIIISDTFGAAGAFPIVFGGLASVMGASMLANARVVSRFGTRRMAHGVLLVYVAVAAGLTVVALASGGRPPLWVFVVSMAPMLAAHALLIPNFNTIAMTPMGAIAGTASSVIGFAQVAGGALIGAMLDRAFDGTVRPLALGFLGLGAVALLLVLWAERWRLFQPLTRDAVPVVADITEAPPERGFA